MGGASDLGSVLTTKKAVNPTESGAEVLVYAYYIWF
jgi:hypothetical protein